jgi:hypothetical protein
MGQESKCTISGNTSAMSREAIRSAPASQTVEIDDL